MTQGRLVNLAIMSIETDILREIVFTALPYLTLPYLQAPLYLRTSRRYRNVCYYYYYYYLTLPYLTLRGRRVTA